MLALQYIAISISRPKATGIGYNFPKTCCLSGTENEWMEVPALNRKLQTKLQTSYLLIRPCSLFEIRETDTLSTVGSDVNVKVNYAYIDIYYISGSQRCRHERISLGVCGSFCWGNKGKESLYLTNGV